VRATTCQFLTRRKRKCSRQYALTYLLAQLQGEGDERDGSPEEAEPPGESTMEGDSPGGSPGGSPAPAAGQSAAGGSPAKRKAKGGKAALGAVETDIRIDEVRT